MKIYKIKYQSMFQYWTSDSTTVKIKATSEFDAECKLIDMLNFDGQTLKMQLYSFEFI